MCYSGRGGIAYGGKVENMEGRAVEGKPYGKEMLEEVSGV